MNLKLDIFKEPDGSHMLHICLDTPGQEGAKFIAPLGKDLLYALYKGLNLELKHLDVAVNEFGKQAQARVQDGVVADESQPEAEVRTTYSALSTEDTNQVLPE